MGLGLDYQQKYYSDLSTGILKVGSNGDDPSTNITVNNALTITSATQVLTTRVNFEVLSHNLTAGQTFIPVGCTPAAYNGSFTVDNVVDSDNIEVILLSDPSGDATVVGTYDDGTLNVSFSGKYRIVDRVSDSNGAPANNQFSKSRSRIFNWAALSNIDHTAIATDGNIIIAVDDTEVISLLQLASGKAVLPIYSDTEPHLNSHVQIGSITKQSGVFTAGTNESNSTINNNPSNRTQNIAGTMGTINTTDNPIVITPISATIGIAKNAGLAFLGTAAGYVQSKGFNPNQNQVLAASPSLVITVDRAGDGNIVNVSSIVNVEQYESSPGVFTAKGASKASNNFIIAFRSFVVELLGQITYSGGSRLTDASTAGEAVDNPGISIFGALAAQISIEVSESDLDNAIFSTLKQFR